MMSSQNSRRMDSDDPASSLIGILFAERKPVFSVISYMNFVYMNFIYIVVTNIIGVYPRVIRDMHLLGTFIVI